MVPRVQAEAIGRRVIGKLKELLERELFPVALQAAIGTQIIARETLPALKKNVTLHLYGGDRSRKMKLWKKQKQGKKRLAQFGKVRVKPEVFFEVFKVAKD
jgi:GTP-binding protein LepA